MRAVVVRSGTIEIADVPTPRPGPGQVLIRVAAATVNPVDLATRGGVLVEVGVQVPRPVCGLGWDVAGTVEGVGDDVTAFVVGDQVIGLCDLVGGPVGTQAEYAVLDAGAVALAPKGVSPVEAATVPLNGLTAGQALDLAGLAPGQTVLVTGAAGGVGGFAVELAVARGLRVVAVAGAHDEDLLRGLGATWFLARPDDLATAARAVVPGGVDGVIDAAVIGLPALGAVRGGGSFVSVVGGTAPPPLRGTRVANVWVRADGAQLAALVRLVEAGKLTLRVAGTLPLDEAAKAHQQLADGGLRGRLVLVP